MIPILIGITGHRDIPTEDEAIIRQAIRFRLESLARRYPSSTFQLLTGLAEGADQIFAEEALRLPAFQIAAVLPMPQKEYEADFQDEASLAGFRSLLAKAVWSIDTYPEFDPDTRDECYKAVGQFISRNAQIVFALWDGIVQQVGPDGEMAVLVGGTADVVHMCRKGIKSHQPLALPEPTSVEHLFVFRVKNGPEFKRAHQDKLGLWQPVVEPIHLEIRQRIDSVLAEIDCFNSASKKLSRSVIEMSKNYLFEGHPNPSVLDSQAASIKVYAAADALAGEIQKQRFFAIKFTSMLAMFAILWQQIYSGPDMRLGWLAAHLLTAIAAYLVFARYFRGANRRDEQFLDWRALSEGLRVQIFWSASGINKQISDFYFSEDTDELEWLRHAARNIGLNTKPDLSEQNLMWVRSVWLEGQKKYFVRKAPFNDRLDRRFTLLVRSLLAFAGVVTLATFVVHCIDNDAVVLNLLVLTSGMSFVLAAVLKSYTDQMAFSELKNRYKVMARIYEISMERFDECFEVSDFKGCKDILSAAGREALTENAGWLRVHRQRQFEISVA